MSKNIRNPLVAIALLCYLLSPVDLIPDVTPILGWLDDLALVAAAYLKWRSEQLESQNKQGENQQAKKKTKKENKKFSAKSNFELASNDPYRTLEIVAPASQAEIKKAFHRLAKIHHPDRVSANGDDKALAHEKMLQITRAYNRLRKVG